MFNLCIKNVKIPDEWKVGLVTPIFKGSGLRSNLESYRPITVLSPISKVFEALGALVSKIFYLKV